MNNLMDLLIVFAVLIVVWLATDYFSPHPLLTTVVKVVLFLVFIFVVVTKLLPMAGVHV